VISLTGWHPQYVRRLAREGRLKHRPSQRVRPNGRVEREYALSSLPVEAQLKFLKQPLLSRPASTALAIRSNPNQSSLFASLPEVTEPERLNFSPEQNTQAMKRLEAVAPLLEFRSRSKRSRPTFRTVGGLAVRSMKLSDRLSRRSAPGQCPYSLELVCAVPQTGLCRSRRSSSFRQGEVAVPQGPSCRPRIHRKQVPR
jgi:hypothetical protein